MVKKFIRATYLWIFLLPVGLYVAGIGCNQAVLVANQDRFPVMWNTYKAVKLDQDIIKATQSKDPDKAEDARFDLIALEEYGYLDDTHILMSDKTKLNFLADWIDFRLATYSPGDMMIFASESLWDYFPFLWAVLICLKVYRLTV